MSLPGITSQSDDVNVTTLCNSASFVCTARGYGLIKIGWKRVTYTLPITADVTEEKSLNELSSTLTISEIFGYYSGQYYCIVENEAGKVTSRIVNLCVKTSKVNIYNNIDSYTMYVPVSSVILVPAYTVWCKILMGENIDEFNEFSAICQYFPYHNFPLI